MNNSINYGNFIDLLMKNSNIGNVENTVNLDKCTSRSNKPVHGNKKKHLDIETLAR